MQLGKRGALIVLEGCDRSGKSSQSRLLFEFLCNRGVQAKHLVFPNRSSEIGGTINAYLKNSRELNDQVIHLLFTANRWEFKKEIEDLLNAGTTLVVDRYSYSGVAYSVAKGLDFDWCMAPEKGLIRPDAVFYLKAPIEQLMQRGEFGEERYEKKDFQLKVASVFDRICENQQHFWHKIDATQTQALVLEDLSTKVLEVIEQAKDKPMKVL
ncbi:PREDICTED: thymidylate kinase [Rhagoletis zephyria]|uniref:thymidylate kinase n=1 Tax=Rhagoletis zephyria TaxID=28612 RepID=UPI0008113905|nr:PREDICTED: thymidylate kinase [Rhagoletis zephyria]XP_036330509.1 thymidylate kinase [Rhagoletis pomonella]